MLPTLEGQVTFDHTTENWFFKGLWAMTPQQLRTGVRSAFHYVHKDNTESSDPRTGSYSGHFMLKTADADQKVLEDDVTLVFDEKDGEQHVTGQGSNQYGPFTLEGKFQNGKLVLSKKYVAAPVANTLSRVRKRSPAVLASETSATKQAPPKRPKIVRKKSQPKAKPPVLAPILRGKLSTTVWEGTWALTSTLLEQGKSQTFRYQRQHGSGLTSVASVTASSSSGETLITSSLASTAAPSIQTLDTVLDTSGPPTNSLSDSGTAACGPDSVIVAATEVTPNGTNIEQLVNTLSGLFDGYFTIQMVADDADSFVKVDEKGVEMKFDMIPGETSRLQCTCTGRNKIGKFQMKGFYSVDTGVLECVKTYVYDKVPKKKVNVSTPRASSRAKVATPKALASQMSRVAHTKQVAHAKHTPPSAGRPRSVRKRVAPAYLRSEDANNDAIMSRCAKVLRQVSNNKNAAPFLQPVDHVALKIPDYPIIIKHPMDLGTIKTKLENGQYTSPRDFEHDVNLVFRNATVYNKPGTVVHELCKALNKVFDRLFLPVKKAMLKREPKPVPKPEPKPKKPKKREPKPGRKFAPRKKKETSKKKKSANSTASTSASASGSASKRRPRPRRRSSEVAEIAQLKKELAAIKEWQLAQMSAKPKPKPKPKKKAPPKPKMLTQAEKHQLSQQIKMLPGEKLTKVLKIISDKMPISHGSHQSEIVIDMESLDTATLRTLQKYVRQQSSARNRKNPAQMEEMARKMNQGTQERIDFLKQSLERQKMQSESSSDSSFDSDSDSGTEEILHLGGSSSTYY